jgi:hypothetical protein
MAEKKKATGAGPHSGYSKNYQPIKSSKGTAAENLVQKGLRAVAKDGSKTVRVKGPDGKMRTVQVQEAGGLGKVVSSVAKNLLPKGGKAASAGKRGVDGKPRSGSVSRSTASTQKRDNMQAKEAVKDGQLPKRYSPTISPKTKTSPTKRKK